MKVSQRAFSLLLVVTFVFCRTALSDSLHDQLGLAEKDEDVYAQIELIRRILEKDPGDSELREQLADLWLSVEDYDMAESTVREWKDAPEEIRVSVLAAVLFARDQKRPEAAAMLERYLAGQRENLKITRQLTEYLHAMGQEERILDLLSQAPAIQSDAELMVSRALARGKLLDFAGALEDFAAAEELDPQDESVVKARPFFDRLKAALPGIEDASALLASKPNDTAARISRAYWYLSTDFASGAALADAEAARRIDPNAVAARILLAGASNKLDRLPAEKALDQIGVDVSKPIPPLDVLDRIHRYDVELSKNDKDVAAHLARSEACEQAQQFQLALRDVESVLAIDPANAGARAQRIAALVKLARLEDATGELRALEAANPPSEVMARASSNLAAAAAGASQFDLALEFASRAVKANPAARYYKQRASIFQRLERFADAQADLSRAQELEKGGAP